MNLTVNQSRNSLDAFADAVRADLGKPIFHLNDRLGAGKSTILQRLFQRLSDRELQPIVVAPATRSVDTGPAILLQLGDGLGQYGLLNGHAAILNNPCESIETKSNMIADLISQHSDRVVLLCDEPEEWLQVEHDTIEDSYSNRRRKLIVSALLNLRCRTVVAGRLSSETHQLLRHSHKSLHIVRTSPPDFRETLNNGLASVAERLQSRGDVDLDSMMPLERRILVLLAKLSSPDEAVSYYAQWTDAFQLASRLVEIVASLPNLSTLRELWAKMSLFRYPLDDTILGALGAHSLDPDITPIVFNGLLQKVGNSYLFHDVFRYAKGVVDGYSRSFVTDTHDIFASVLTSPKFNQSSRRMTMASEAFFHAANAGTINRYALEASFGEQLHIQGRILSRQLGNHAAAAAVFREAVRLDDEDDYAHHYLAYNVDWTASDEDLADREYKRATEINPTHPWWWSRRINFLITTGRIRDAKLSWTDALDELGLMSGEGADFVYRELHKWIARLLLHRGQLDFAERVLAVVPDAIMKSDVAFLALKRLMETLREAEDGRGVFPWTISPDQWWDRYPHLDFPIEFKGEQFKEWYPARVESVDDQNVWLVVGKRPDMPNARPSYGRVAIPVARLDPNVGPQANELRPYRFLELVYYGANGTFLILMHPETVSMDPALPGFDPPDTRRYLREPQKR